MLGEREILATDSAV